MQKLNKEEQGTDDQNERNQQKSGWKYSKAKQTNQINVILVKNDANHKGARS